MKKVMAFGTFDIFHPGHESFLKQAKKMGDFLIVVIARDKVVEKIKGKLPRNDENKRMNTIKKSDLANKVILGESDVKYGVIAEHKPDIIALGYDQKNFIRGLEKRLKEMGLPSTKIVRLEPYKPEKYKSSKLSG